MSAGEQGPPAGVGKAGGFIGLLARHRVAPNLIMVLMLLAGFFALGKLQTQFFPNFQTDIVLVSVIWSGAAPEDIEQALIEPLETELRELSDLKKLTSASRLGRGIVIIEFEPGVEIGLALDDVKERVARVRNLPADAEEPAVTLLSDNDATRSRSIARVLLTGPASMSELRALAHRAERELLDAGIGDVNLNGLPAEELAIEIPSAQLRELGISLADVGQQLAARSVDLPAGTAGRADMARQLRSLEQRRSERELGSLVVAVDANGRRLTVDDVGTVTRQPRPNQVTLFQGGKPAIELDVFAAESQDLLDGAVILNQWLEETRATLPAGYQLQTYDVQWQPLQQRIDLLLKNGAGGLLLILAILFIFLNGRVAFWVAVGIPTSFMATLLLLWYFGGTIDMLSLFGMLMALGVIVDDAIVVGEDVLARYQQGHNAPDAAIGGALRMLAPVASASVTTIAAFTPLLLVSGITGAILFAIPLVVICVVIASLVECFMVLPGHLNHSLAKAKREDGRFRRVVDSGFNRFRDGPFRALVSFCVNHRSFTLACAMACLILSIGLLAGKRVQFEFFPSPEIPVVLANVQFVAGTPSDRVSQYLQHLQSSAEETAAEIEQESGDDIFELAVQVMGFNTLGGPTGVNADQNGLLRVQLTEPDERTIRNGEFIRRWQERIQQAPGLELLSISTPRGGPPGRDVEVSLSGAGVSELKAASEWLQQQLRGVAGVLTVEDNTPYGREQLIYSLTPTGEALGLSTREVGRQLRAAFDGQLVQIFQDNGDEVEVRVMLPAVERDRISNLRSLPLTLPGGGTALVGQLVNFESQRGFETLRHSDSKLAVKVQGDIDPAIINANALNKQLETSLLPQLQQKWPAITYKFEGQQENQAQTGADMKRGALYAIVMIYIVLAWVFNSYSKPLVVMSVIPFAIVGAIVGHWALGLTMSLLTFFGFFALSGIVVNDSIVLVTAYRELRARDIEVNEALIQASCQRLRAVMLTSLTTIAGLLPLLFETSLQAQFLIPMAATLVFGLAFGTLLVLIMVPALISSLESFQRRISGKATPRQIRLKQST